MSNDHQPPSTTTDNEQLVDTLIAYVADATNLNDPNDLRIAREVFHEYPHDLLKQLVEQATSNKLSHLTIVHLSNSVDSTSMREAVCFYPHLTTKSTFFAKALLHSLRNYPQLPQLDDYSTADETTRKQCIAIMVATEIINSGVDEQGEFINSATDESGNFLELIRDPALVDLLIERPDQATSIANLVIERKTTDTKLIKSVLEHDNPALANGIL